jgi:hypothetical protein
MDALIELWTVIADELGDGCSVDTTQDQILVLRRTKTEGGSFLAITLPDYLKDFDRSLSDGKVSRDSFSGFARRGHLPIFLGGFLDRVFDRSTGILLDVPHVDSVYAVRQLTGLYSKLLLECSTERTNKAYREYIECEKELTARENEWSQTDYLDFSRISRLVFGRVLSRMDDIVAHGDLLPKHGPGATADRLSGNRKFDLQKWHSRLESSFPSSDYLIPNYRYRDRLDRVEFLEPGNEIPVKVIDVPKTMKTPRLIAKEPTCMQYTQQALAVPLMDMINRDKIASMFISFRDQKPNQLLAREGSRTGGMATLDLSEASDRVSIQLVEWLLHGFTDLKDAVMNCRSTRADVRGEGIPLTKFASMGSALTFPIETMVFLTIALVGIERSLGFRLTTRHLKQMAYVVRIYGDDIIVPTDSADEVVATLEAYHFKVNTRKSHWNGNFRESCGKEYFRGHDVSIVKARRLFPTNLTDVPAVISLVALRNLIYMRGLYKASEFLDDVVRAVLPHWPDGHPGSPGLVRVVDGPLTYEKFCSHKHVGLVKAYVPRYKYKRIVLDDTGALLKHFLKVGKEPYFDKKHLVRSGRPVAASIKPRWIDPGLKRPVGDSEGYSVCEDGAPEG